MADTVDILLRLLRAREFIQDSREASKAVGGVGASAEKTGRQAKLGWKGVAKWAAGAGALVGVTRYLQGAVEGASDLNEQINKTTVVFGAQGKSVIKWSENSATALAMSRQQALEAAGTFGNMLVPMGFASRRAAHMSQRMVKLAADMSSFNNASPEETLLALRSGLAGETEPLRRYGVFLNQTRIEAQAMAMGLVKGARDMTAVKKANLDIAVASAKAKEELKKHGQGSLEYRKAAVAVEVAQGRLGKAMKGSKVQLTAAQKAQATYALIMKDTTLQTDDLKNTSGGLANRQRILTAQLTDMRTNLGTQLLPAITGVVGALLIFAKILTPLMKNATLFKGIIITVTTAFIAYKGAMIVATVAQNLFNITMTATQIIITGGVIIAIIALIAAIYLLIKHWDKVKLAAQFVWNWIKKNWPLLVAILLGPFAIAVYTIAKHWQQIKQGAAAAVTWIKSKFDELIDYFRNLPGRIGNWFKKIPGVGLLGRVGGAAGGGVPFVPHLQHGGAVLRGGRALVGERGPEVVSLPAGATVAPLARGQTLALAGAGGGGPQTIVTKVYLDRRQIAEAVGTYTSDKLARR